MISLVHTHLRPSHPANLRGGRFEGNIAIRDIWR